MALAMALTVAPAPGRSYAVDTLLGVLAHAALAAGLVALSFLHGVRVDLMGYLFGDILAVSRGDLAVIWGGAAAIVALLAWRWRGLLLSTLNEDLAASAGVDPRRERLILTLALALLVAVALKVVGALLVTALLIVPAAAARAFATLAGGDGGRRRRGRRAVGGMRPVGVVALRHPGRAVYRRGGGGGARPCQRRAPAPRAEGTLVTDVLLLHSVYGCRPSEQAIAERLRGQGHRVVVPDLYDGRTAATVDAGFAICGEVGMARIAERAAGAAAGMPPATVLAGVSMGAGVAADLWARRPEAAGILLLHGVGAIPEAPRAGVPLQLHLAEPDDYEDEALVAEWRALAAERGVAIEAFRYPGAGHYFLDAAFPTTTPGRRRWRGSGSSRSSPGWGRAFVRPRRVVAVVALALGGGAGEVGLEVGFEAGEVVGDRQAEGVHLGDLLAEQLLQLVRVVRVGGDLVEEHREPHPEFLERHGPLPVPLRPGPCHNGAVGR